MAELRVLLVGEGRHELGDRQEEFLSGDALGPLATLVCRIINRDETIRFFGRAGKRIRNVHRGKASSAWVKKVYSAIWHAANDTDGHAFDAVVIVVDRDGEKNSNRLSHMKQGRDMFGASRFPCALGVAIEAFDAWMIADAQAIEAAGGDGDKAHASPEEIHRPKEEADAIFGTRGGTGLGFRYAVVAGKADLACLESCCPQGFKPFADEVRDKIGSRVGL